MWISLQASDPAVRKNPRGDRGTSRVLSKTPGPKPHRLKRKHRTRAMAADPAIALSDPYMSPALPGDRRKAPRLPEDDNIGTVRF
jgi:hypothetical protein